MIKSIVPAALVAAALVQGTATDFVELDVVALDRHGSPVTDLAATDFDVRDGGNRVRIQTFSQIAARGIDADEERSVVILMDDGDMLRVRFHRRRQRQFAHVVRIDDDALEEVRVADLVEQELGLRERLMNRSGDRQRERGLLIPLAGNLGDGRTIAESWRGDERTESAVTRANAPNEPADLLVRRWMHVSILLVLRGFSLA